MNLYLDTSVLVALLAPDPLSDRASTFLGTAQDSLVVSDLAAAEFSSAIARLVRMGSMPEDDARARFADFDMWVERVAGRVGVEPTDMRRADLFLRRLDLTLLAPDAIHIAIAQRLNTTLATFDRKMAVSATLLGVKVAEI